MGLCAYPQDIKKEESKKYSFIFCRQACKRKTPKGTGVLAISKGDEGGGETHFLETFKQT